MPRPCIADHPFRPAACVLCHLVATSAFHCRAWGEPWAGPPATPPPRPAPPGSAARPPSPAAARPPCLHEGPVLEHAPCDCALRHVRDCAVHDRCTRGPNNGAAASCAACPDYETEPPEPAPMIAPADVRPETPVEQLTELLEHGPPGPWPAGWTAWDNVQQAHLRLLERRVATLPEYPGGFSGRGVVSCVSAKPGHSSGKHLPHGYLPGAWVLVKELRRLGCSLPVTFAYLGPLEMDPALERLLAPLGVTCIDLREIEKKDPMRILAGWESKVYAVQHAPYRQVLYLDADNVPARDPTYLFDSVQFRTHGAIFWPDLPPHDRPEWLPADAWASVGLGYRDEPDFESGQLLIDKGLCWKELLLARWVNEHSDRYFRVFYGDKSTFHAAWARLGTPYAMPSRPAGWEQRAIVQHDFSGNRVFYHACQDKPSLRGYADRGYLPDQDACDAHLAELRERWSGVLWENPGPTPEEAALRDGLAGKTFLYERHGLDRRPMRLLADERIGRGMAKLEVSWAVFCRPQGPVMVIRSADDVPTAFLALGPDGSWRGRWLEYERCEVSLTPLEEESRG